MKTIFDKTIREKLIERIGQINQNDNAKWGKMNVFQMLKHNTYWNGWIIGKDDHNYKQAFMGKIFGKIALKKMIKDERPFDKNIPTSAQFKVKELNGELEFKKSKWISLIKEYENYNNPEFVHDFFGKMTKEQIGVLVYKHTDHHLRQFGI
mgnify:CR=1 FL=1